ncbi:MAG: phosphate transport regulator related to PhoU [Deltaproteobacteria bacterium]|nr:phosphate transport regulator related to PhoU [Deltaproteobacteria bacterium]
MSWFRKKKCDFCEMLHAQSEKVQEGLDALHTWAEGGQTPQRERVKQIEREADELRRIVIEELNQTFVTPFDREDIFSLSRAIDDVMDYADRTVDEMEVYEVMANRHIVEMIDILRKAAHELNDSIRLIQKYPNIALEHATKAKALENEMEKAYHRALADLFKGTDTIYMLKMREIYRHLSNAADRGDEAANIIGDIVVKMT